MEDKARGDEKLADRDDQEEQVPQNPPLYKE